MLRPQIVRDIEEARAHGDISENSEFEDAKERLNRMIEIDVRARTVTVDGGVLLSQLNEALAEHGFWFPVDLGADPQIGGMIATNTGGTRLLKYGDVRRNLLGVEVVLGDEQVVTYIEERKFGIESSGFP